MHITQMRRRASCCMDMIILMHQFYDCQPQKQHEKTALYGQFLSRSILSVIEFKNRIRLWFEPDSGRPNCIRGLLKHVRNIEMKVVKIVDKIHFDRNYCTLRIIQFVFVNCYILIEKSKILLVITLSMKYFLD